MVNRLYLVLFKLPDARNNIKQVLPYEFKSIYFHVNVQPKLTRKFRALFPTNRLCALHLKSASTLTAVKRQT